MSYNETKQFDVIILGSGLAGSILATILARHNVRVLMIDKDAHPRFAIGEAMTPDTDLLMSILSYQYSVPELAHLSSFHDICENISPSSCGLKRSFNFIYHREGEEQTLQETNKFGVHPSSHLFRQDVDHYMAKTAVNYGAKILENTNIIDINIDRKGIEIKVDGDEEFTANYLVDASGYKSLLSSKFNLRENQTRFKTHSRSIFTHMIGVKKYDDCVQSIEENQDDLILDELPWYQGTLHHIFDGGWMWVIPFNNHEESTNPISSVGLTLDTRRFPKTEISPEQEFKNFLSRFPGIGIQFENAQPVRNWVSTDRLQYSSHSCVGERFYLLPHAAGFIDPLFSFGLVSTCTIILPLASRIMKAISENDYSTKHFAGIGRLQQKLFDFNDDLVNGSYISFTNFNLWNAWRRFWVIGNFIRLSKRTLAAIKGEGLLQLLNDDKNLDILTPTYEGLSDNFFLEATAIVEKVEEGLISPDDAASKLMSLIKSIDFLPPNFLRIADASRKNIDVASEFASFERKRFLYWIKTSSSPEVKKYFGRREQELKDLATAAITIANTIERLRTPAATISMALKMRTEGLTSI